MYHLLPTHKHTSMNFPLCFVREIKTNRSLSHTNKQTRNKSQKIRWSVYSINNNAFYTSKIACAKLIVAQKEFFFCAFCMATANRKRKPKKTYIFKKKPWNGFSFCESIKKIRILERCYHDGKRRANESWHVRWICDFASSSYAASLCTNVLGAHLNQIFNGYCTLFHSLSLSTIRSISINQKLLFPYICQRAAVNEPKSHYVWLWVIRSDVKT